jgi:hypothetical protein
MRRDRTLSDFFEVYRPKSPDEQKFVDKHITVKIQDRAGNKDDVFNATNVKPALRKEKRHGYQIGADEKVYEESDIDEATRVTPKSYMPGSNGPSRGGPIDLEAAMQPKKPIVPLHARIATYPGKHYVWKHNKETGPAGTALKDEKGNVKYFASKEAAQEHAATLNKARPSTERRGDFHTYGGYGTMKEAKEPWHDEEEAVKGTVPAFMRKKKHEDAMKAATGGSAVRTAKNEDIELDEKHLTAAEMEKREEIAKAMERENPGMDKSKKMAIATASAKRVAESVKLVNKQNVIESVLGRYVPALETYEPMSEEDRIIDKLDGLFEEHIVSILELYNSLDEDNKLGMMDLLDTSDGVNEILDFVISNGGN